MSLILDALRKMEQDRNSRRGSALDIRPEVLRYRAASRKRPRSWLPWAVGAVLLACGIGAGFFLKGNHPTSVSEEIAPAPVPSAATISVAPIAPVVPAAPVTPVVPAAPILPVLSEPAATPVALPQAAPVAVKPAVKPAPLRLPVAAAAPVRAVESVGKSRVKPAHREEAVAPQGAAPADISITGIAWQDERGLRRAVINGSLVGEGAEIAGARVLEIREDRVRLSRNGQVFDALFSAGFAR